MTIENNNKKKTQKKKIKKEINIKKFNDLEGKFLLVKVGDKDRPANNEDIENIKDKLVDFFEKNHINCLAFVTHHAVEMEIIEKLTQDD